MKKHLGILRVYTYFSFLAFKTLLYPQIANSSFLKIHSPVIREFDALYFHRLFVQAFEPRGGQLVAQL